MKDKEFLEFRKQLGQHIQALRKAREITQEELAARVNLDRVSIGYIEQGIRTPKLRTLLLITEALECSLLELLSFKN